MSKHESHDEVVDDWNLPMEFHLFAKHETRTVYLNSTTAEDLRTASSGDKRYDAAAAGADNGATLELECVDSLTPLDMMGLSSGAHDATGHCVWTGAFFFISVLDSKSGAAAKSISSDDPKDHSPSCAGDILSSIFQSKRVIELGCGTGIGGLALCKSTACKPSQLCFTDADPDVLALCHRNCERNLQSESSIEESGLQGNLANWATVKLTWGQDPLPTGIEASSFDAVLATDVLYDIGLLPALLRTTSACLVKGGHFCLSHVPRACYNSEHPPVDNLEAYIVEKAQQHGFEPVHTIRPRDCEQSTRIPSNAFNYVRMNDLDQVGAAILAFVAIDT